MRVGAVITCECGFEARAADEEGLIAEVRRHAVEAHCMPLSHEEALLLAFHAELAAQPTTHRKTAEPREPRTTT
jgi:predicted small metal-binding protein